MELSEQIKQLSEKYREYTAEVLGKMIRIPGFSGKEEDRCKAIVKLCEEAGFDEVYIAWEAWSAGSDMVPRSWHLMRILIQ